MGHASRNQHGGSEEPDQARWGARSTQVGHGNVLFAASEHAPGKGPPAHREASTHGPRLCAPPREASPEDDGLTYGYERAGGDLGIHVRNDIVHKMRGAVVHSAGVAARAGASCTAAARTVGAQSSNGPEERSHG
jgi:hypothetical protein